MSGIDGLADLNAVSMSVETLLERVSAAQRTVLEEALRLRHPLRPDRFQFSSRAVKNACEQDGFAVSEWSIKQWRRDNVNS